ncbi:MULTISPECIES: hypothetical protein [Halorubrum]|uniref:hypothetical protein n=1 Tax=Halorubrum TaxID=56688 RepID=UPI001181AD44|nr:MULTISPECIES: hypothetical protein [Halorubrum]
MNAITASFLHGSAVVSFMNGRTKGLCVGALSATILISTAWIVIGPREAIIFAIFVIAYPLLAEILGRRTPYS